MARTTLMVRREVGNQLSATARHEGKPLFSLATDIIQTYLDLSRRGYNLREIVEAYECLRLARDTGHTVICKDILDYLIKNLHPVKKDEMRILWNEAGRVAVKYAEGLGRSPVSALQSLLRHVIWGISKSTVEESENGVTMRIYCPSFSDEATELLAEYLDGYMSASGYKSAKKEIIKGLIYSVFGKRSDARPY